MKKMQVVHIIKQAKTDFYKERLRKASGYQKGLFVCVNELLNRTKSSALSSHLSKTELADDMGNVFKNKVIKIRENHNNIQTHG